MSRRCVVEDLPLAVVDEAGFHFETGVPVRFPFIRNTAKAPYLGPRFQQDIEPAGRYVILNRIGEPQEGWEAGVVAFERPLVLAFNTAESGLYDDASWKAHLWRCYGRTGKWLSCALKRDGFDGIVTASTYGGKPYDTREIVDLRGVKCR